MTYLIAVLAMISSSVAQASDWTAYQPLLGTWNGTGNGSPGKSAGVDSFAIDLQGKVLTRKSHSDYPSYYGGGAYSQDSLTVLFQDSSGTVHANYYDSENHFINYTVTATKNSWIFLSDVDPQFGQFRLTYALQNDRTMSVLFEVAPAGNPAQFSSYVCGIDFRK